MTEATVDQTPYLTVGTEVSAKFKGAFCEAKVKKVLKNVTCKVMFLKSNVIQNIPEEFIVNPQNLQINAIVKAKNSLNNQIFDVKILKFIDGSTYTVEFDDGDIRVLKRNLICLKGQKHFQESQTLDKLPLTNPETFGTPVVTKKTNAKKPTLVSSKIRNKTREKSQVTEKLSDETTNKNQMVKMKKETRKKESSEESSSVESIQSYKNVRNAKKGANDVKNFSRPSKVFEGTKTDQQPQIDATGDKIRKKKVSHKKKSAVDLKSINKPLSTREFGDDHLKEQTADVNVKSSPHAGNDIKPSSNVGSNTIENQIDQQEDSEEEEESLEEKDHFIARLFKFMEDRGTPLNKLPSLGSTDINYHKLFSVVCNLGYYNKVTNNEKWNEVCHKIGIFKTSDWPKSLVVKRIQSFYKKYLLAFEDFSRKLGCCLMSQSSFHASSSASLNTSSSGLHSTSTNPTTLSSLVTTGSGSHTLYPFTNSTHASISVPLSSGSITSQGSLTAVSSFHHNYPHIQGRSLIREKRFSTSTSSNLATSSSSNQISSSISDVTLTTTTTTTSQSNISSSVASTKGKKRRGNQLISADDDIDLDFVSHRAPQIDHGLTSESDTEEIVLSGKRIIGESVQVISTLQPKHSKQLLLKKKEKVVKSLPTSAPIISRTDSLSSISSTDNMQETMPPSSYLNTNEISESSSKLAHVKVQELIESELSPTFNKASSRTEKITTDKLPPSFVASSSNSPKYKIDRTLESQIFEETPHSSQKSYASSSSIPLTQPYHNFNASSMISSKEIGSFASSYSNHETTFEAIAGTSAPNFLDHNNIVSASQALQKSNVVEHGNGSSQQLNCIQASSSTTSLLSLQNKKKTNHLSLLFPEVQTDFTCPFYFTSVDPALPLNARIAESKAHIKQIRKLYQKHKSRVIEIEKILKNVQKMEENGSILEDVKKYYENAKENISSLELSSDSSSD